MSEAPGVVVLGAGGHAKVVIATLLAAGFSIEGVLDDSSAKWGVRILGFVVEGPFAKLSAASRPHCVMAIGDNRQRREVAARFPAMEWVSAVHPFSSVHPTVEIGPGTVVAAGAVIQPETRIGRHCIVNTGATIDHDCSVGDFSHVAPGTHLAGGVRLAAGVFLGIGSAVAPGVGVGDWTVVGAGGVVVHDLPGGVTAVGVPARSRP